MKRDAVYFEGKEPVLVYIAKRLRDALRLESIFTESGIDFGVEADHYRGGVVFRTVRAGAFFYVLQESAAAAKETMQRHGYSPFEGENPALD